MNPSSRAIASTPQTPPQPQPQARVPRSGLWSAASAVGAAVLASACCWLPLLLLTMGVSAAGVGGLFARTRPYFLVAAGLLLAAGFYFTYFRKPACGPGDACATPHRRVGRFNQAMLWVAAVMVVAVALFPKWGAALLASPAPSPATTTAIADTTTDAATINPTAPTASAAAPPPGTPATPTTAAPAADAQVVTLKITGMTCEVCAVGLQNQFNATPGVAAATVRYAPRTATIHLAPDHPATLETLTAIVRNAGYRAAPPSPTTAAPHTASQ